MIVLSANNLTKAYGEDVILDNISFHLNDGDRVGIIGRNGEGKTTLLNLLTGEMSAESGEVFISQSLKVGYLKQRDHFFKEDTVYKAVDRIFTEIHRVEKEIERLTKRIDLYPIADDINELDRLHLLYEKIGGYTYQSEMTGVLLSMGFDSSWYDKKIETLSGGERTRLALAALLLEKPDILLLDEPTNHLDIDTLKWLEGYLSQYKGTIMIVSHDRYFLDRVVNRIFEVERHRLRIYEGNYTEYLSKRRKIREVEQKAYDNQQKEIKRQEEIIRVMMEHNTEHLVKRAQSRMKRLDMVERLDKPENELGKISFHFSQEFKSGEDVLLVKDLKKEFYDADEKKIKRLFENVSMDIKRGEKVCIVGANGIGKTTLLKMILSEEEVTAGRIRIGHNVEFGYYDQGQLLLNPENTLLEEMKDEFRMYTDTEMRKILGRFLFTGDEVFLKIKDLSGGEKARLSLCKLMLSGANTLLLDEPTNHLDIASKEIFEEALLDFPGTAIIVSHDRYFLEKIPNRILELNDYGITEFLGNYDYYLEKKDERRVVKEKQETANVKSQSYEERQKKKEEDREERRKKRQIENTEKEIALLEEKISEVEAELSLPENMSDYGKLSELSSKLEDLKSELNMKYELWESLM
ncbi:MAG: ATP-binding cassette domain-containing protein [Clostridia bacterium]|nr:ATP-binding cassette domain-containing protein [Clostridia bacterium]